MYVRTYVRTYIHTYIHTHTHTEANPKPYNPKAPHSALQDLTMKPINPYNPKAHDPIASSTINLNPMTPWRPCGGTAHNEAMALRARLASATQTCLWLSKGSLGSKKGSFLAL